MNNIKRIRNRLGVTQQALADGMGCTQGNVAFYEKGQTVTPEAAEKLIAYAKTLGVALTYDDIYSPAPAELDQGKVGSAVNDPVTPASDATQLLSPQHPVPYSGPNRRQYKNPPPPDLERREAEAAALAAKSAKAIKKSHGKTPKK